ncbi:MAG: glycosyltransferase [Coprothermobacterota bacterium]|nr:glycosyltransferase [Coprothermobacterota bacterium]
MSEAGWVVIPCYNEEGNMTPLLERLEDVFASQGLAGWRILCVNDGSHDGTKDEIEGEQGRFGNIVRLDHAQNRGFAQAIRTAVPFLLQQTLDFAIFMDADFTHDPEHLPRFRQAFAKGAEVVIGSRYVAHGGMVNVALWRRVLSRAGNLFGRMMGLPVHDATSGYRGFSRRGLEVIAGTKEEDFSIQLEEVLLCKRAKLRFAEVPITLKVREVGISKFSYSFALFRRYGALLLRNLRG